MDIHKRILTFFLLIAAFLISACTNSKHVTAENFPVEKDGYPKNNYIIINGKNIELKEINKVDYLSDKKFSEEIKIYLKGRKDIEIILPQIDVVTNWAFDEDMAELNSFEKINLKVNEVKEGGSNMLLKYNLSVSEDELVFKFYNSNEAQKQFENIDEYYKLTIKLK